MPANTLIQIRKGTSAQWAGTNPVLASGEPGYDSTSQKLKIGDGSTAWNSLAYEGSVSPSFTGTVLVNGTGVSLSGHSHTSSNISDFNSSVSGLLPITSIVAGSNISISQLGTIYTINSTGASTGSVSRGYITASSGVSSVPIPSGYLVGQLDIFQNGVKLIENVDFSATDGTNIILSGVLPSGSYLEYLKTGLPLQNIVAGSGISVTSSSGVYTITNTGSSSSSSSVDIIHPFLLGGL